MHSSRCAVGAMCVSERWPLGDVGGSYSLEALARDFLRGHKELMKKPMKQL